ncbi:UNVERIFIED_CONTAM: hypothetical protein FKN15_045396 [Acipenser sinensis]
MSQFMEVMMGQQSLLMTLANVVPRAPELPTGPIAGQPVVPPPVPHDQPQEVWDVDAVSRDASDAEPLFEEGTEPEVTSQHSEQDDPEVLDTNDPMWSVVERAARHLSVDWPASEPTRRSLFELPSAQPLQSRILPAFPDFIKEVQSTWGAPASTPATSRKASAFTMHGASEAGLASFPPVGAAFAALVKAPTLSGLAKDPSCPNRQCRITEAHLKKGYAAATEAVRLSNVASLLMVYQAMLLRDLPECPSAALRTELGTIAQLLIKLAQLNAQAQGRSIASLVVARRQLWLSQARVQEPDKAPLLDAPISPGHTFGPAVEEMLQRSLKARSSKQPRPMYQLLQMQWFLNIRSSFLHARLCIPSTGQMNILYRESEVIAMCTRFQLPASQIVEGFCEYKDNGDNVPDQMFPLITTLETIAISTAECEFVFSTMNNTVTPIRNSLRLIRVSNLLFLHRNSPPLTHNQPQSYVKTWLVQGRQRPDHTACRERKHKEDADQKKSIWGL